MASKTLDPLVSLSRPFAVALALATLVACGGGGGAGAAPSPPAPAPVPAPAPSATVADEVVVQLLTGQRIADLASAYDLTVVDQFGKRPIWRLRTRPGTNIDALVTRLRADARVRFAEANAESETPESRHLVPWAVGGDAGTYATQWAPEAIRLASAQNQGAGIRVAVLDTGIDLTHPALASRLARTASGALLGRDFVDDDADPSEGGTPAQPGFGHGTHVSGLVSLVAPQARIMPVRVLDERGRGNLWVLSEALGWAVDPDGDPNTDDGAHVINLSLATTRPTTLLQVATAIANCDFSDDEDDIDYSDPGFDDDRVRCANRFAAVVAAAAGNAGSATELQYPAAEAVPGSISVTASAQNRSLSPLANRGPWVEIAAPGDRIISTFPGGGYATWSGTSMATPLVAGTATLVLASRPTPRDLLPQDVTARLLARSGRLCGSTIPALDAGSAANDTSPPPPAPCP
ncbi:S8 family serine peptidase [Piscinibacterium candidicorallinum]|uniref:S8 family serine peptidase n=1 Tax=Piscinibacterium candidicorallinum TaxID=1793872 RepID=A0ABV7H973_9BURK